jgi:CMP-N,N'-diacetyllegionaminic acid synthase
MNNKILFSIAGRAGSKGIKGKNAKKFLRYPLVLYSLSAIDLYLKKNAEAMESDIALNTDSEELIDIFNRQKMRQVEIVKRSEELAGDGVGKFFVLKNSLTEMENRTKKTYDLFVDFDITSPLRTVKDIENLIAKKRQGDFDCVFSCVDARRSPYFNQVEVKEDRVDIVIKKNFVARQQSPKILDMNGSIYAYTPSFIKEKNYLFDGKCGATEMMDFGILDLDRESEFEIMEVVAKHLYEKYPAYNEIRENIAYG